MKSTPSDAHACAIFFAIRHTNFSDSITHGPRMNTGRLPPIVTLPILRGLAFIKRSFSRWAGLRSIDPSSAFAPAQWRDCVVQDREWQMVRTIRERRSMRVHAVAGGKAATHRRENSKWKTLPVYAAKIRN